MKSTHHGSDTLLTETVTHLRSMLGPEMEQLTVERAVIGIFFSGIQLSNGEGGICFTPVKEIPEAVCCPSSARAMPNSGKLVGQPVGYYIQRMQQGGPLQKALGIAVLNALSATCWRLTPPESYQLIHGVDPVENRTIDKDAEVVVIGALVPYFRMLKGREKPFTILEKDPRTLKPDEMEYFQPQENAGKCIAAADLLIITGTTLINDTLEGILDQMKTGAKAVLVGPTASMLPDAFFSRGITSIGGIMVTDAGRLLDTLAEAGSGYHFYGKSAERLVIEKHTD
ncbi:hypothetical protein DSCO28_70410 [Desulfosarcina ovata subsp. sediminis]|uniref:Fis family transcriptional regulator n=1 Tax=Desulfosarcina ovata subsp. sediminis TaxID=885957 RepID=A0A5K8A1L5_9BACT|nr:DUF364 domain-containing protein [Desulfosarcina ovata]BBO86475.1 hypothetical protein DSCO28_70410 [Desulfosarcina ovata subsp. sediminis]